MTENHFALRRAAALPTVTNSMPLGYCPPAANAQWFRLSHINLPGRSQPNASCCASENTLRCCRTTIEGRFAAPVLNWSRLQQHLAIVEPHSCRQHCANNRRCIIWRPPPCDAHVLGPNMQQRRHAACAGSTLRAQTRYHEWHLQASGTQLTRHAHNNMQQLPKQKPSSLPTGWPVCQHVLATSAVTRQHTPHVGECNV